MLFGDETSVECEQRLADAAKSLKAGTAKSNRYKGPMNQLQTLVDKLSEVDGNLDDVQE